MLVIVGGIIYIIFCLKILSDLYLIVIVDCSIF